MPKQKTKTTNEPDSFYFLKLAFYLIVGSVWVRLEHTPDWSVGLPVGLLVGLVLVRQERFQIDRKIEYAMLILAAFVSFWLPLGLIIQV